MGQTRPGTTKMDVRLLGCGPGVSFRVVLSQWLVVSCRALLCCRASYCFLTVRRRSVSMLANGASKLQMAEKGQNCCNTQSLHEVPSPPIRTTVTVISHTGSASIRGLNTNGIIKLLFEQVSEMGHFVKCEKELGGA